MNIRRWLYFASLVLAFVGAVIALIGSGLVFADQAQIPESRIWPLPGLIFFDWAIIGILGFLGAWLSDKPNGSTWLKVIWFVVGALIPLVILGAFSIGLFVLFTLLFFLASAVILTIQMKGEALGHIELFMVGVICNLGILLVLIITNSLLDESSFWVGEA